MSELVLATVCHVVSSLLTVSEYSLAGRSRHVKPAAWVLYAGDSSSLCDQAEAETRQRTLAGDIAQGWVNHEFIRRDY